MKTTERFDFDTWMELAKQDPEAFENERQAFLHRFISDMPEKAQQRMECLQWRVDKERELSKTPMEAAGRIYDMMWDSVSLVHDELQGLVSILDPNSEHAKTPAKSEKATVLPFKSTGTNR
jgi:hypothetical protein